MNFLTTDAKFRKYQRISASDKVYKFVRIFKLKYEHKLV